MLFLVAFGLAMLTIGLMIAPVAMHRFMFGRHQKDVLVRVRTPHRQVRAGRPRPDPGRGHGLDLHVAAGAVAGVVAGVVVLVFYALVWVALPMSLLRQEGRY